MSKYPFLPFRSRGRDVVLPLWNISQDLSKFQTQYLRGLSLQAPEQTERDMFCFVCSGQPIFLIVCFLSKAARERLINGIGFVDRILSHFNRFSMKLLRPCRHNSTNSNSEKCPLKVMGTLMRAVQSIEQSVMVARVVIQNFANAIHFCEENRPLYQLHHLKHAKH